MPRPFSFASTRATAVRDAGEAVTTTLAETPQWSVAVYEPGMSAQAEAVTPPPPGDLVDASLALDSAVREAEQHANSVAAAAVLESVAHRLRTGEILLPSGTSPRHEAAVVAAVLAALLGEPR